MGPQQAQGVVLGMTPGGRRLAGSTRPRGRMRAPGGMTADTTHGLRAENDPRRPTCAMSGTADDRDEAVQACCLAAAVDGRACVRAACPAFGVALLEELWQVLFCVGLLAVSCCALSKCVMPMNPGEHASACHVLPQLLQEQTRSVYWMLLIGLLG